MSEAAEILAKEMQAIVAADRWKGRDLSAAPPEKWSHLRAETQQFWIDTASRILAAIQPADLVQAKDAALSDAARDVLAERRRQISAEGWTPEHDDLHADGAIARAAAAYAIQSADYPMIKGPKRALAWWPWDRKWWKPTSRRRDLVKAAALIIAEIERLDRAEGKGRT